MENKEVASVRTITGELIGGFILYGIVFYILYNIVYGLVSNMFSSDSLIPLAIVSIILQGLVVFCVWRCSIVKTFKKRAITQYDVSIVMKNLMIFTVIICVLNAVINFIQVNNNFDKSINSNTKLQYSESLMNYMYDDDEIALYQSQKEKMINESKSKLNTYLIVLEVGLFVVYLSVIPLQKKEILKYAV